MFELVFVILVLIFPCMLIMTGYLVLRGVVKLDKSVLRGPLCLLDEFRSDYLQATEKPPSRVQIVAVGSALIVGGFAAVCGVVIILVYSWWTAGG